MPDKMIPYFKQKILLPLFDLLKQGVSPEKLALSASLGFIIGIFPMIGVTTAVCTVVALWLGLNIAAIQIANYAAYPLQLIFYIPFIRAGEKLLGNNISDFTISGIINLFNTGFIQAVKILWEANIQGILVWVMIAAPVSLLLYYIFLFIFRRFVPAEIIEE